MKAFILKHFGTALYPCRKLNKMCTDGAILQKLNNVIFIFTM
jgi:hypothetical protein